MARCCTTHYSLSCFMMKYFLVAGEWWMVSPTRFAGFGGKLVVQKMCQPFPIPVPIGMHKLLTKRGSRLVVRRRQVFQRKHRKHQFWAFKWWKGHLLETFSIRKQPWKQITKITSKWKTDGLWIVVVASFIIPSNRHTVHEPIPATGDIYIWFIVSDDYNDLLVSLNYCTILCKSYPKWW